MPCLRKAWIEEMIVILATSPVPKITIISSIQASFTGSYNIALKKSTHQSPYDWCKNCKQWQQRGNNKCHNCFWSSLAVDGNTNPDTSKGSCSHTDDYYHGNTASWSVNLDGLYYLSWINITNRYDGNCFSSSLCWLLPITTHYCLHY